MLQGIYERIDMVKKVKVTGEWTQTYLVDDVSGAMKHANEVKEMYPHLNISKIKAVVIDTIGEDDKPKPNHTVVSIEEIVADQHMSLSAKYWNDKKNDE